VPGYLGPTKREVDILNKTELDKLETTPHVYVYQEVIPSVIEGCSTKEIRQELTKMLKTLPIEHELTLKVGAQVMCTSNIDVPRGISNGSQGKVIDFRDGNPVVEFRNKIVMTIKPMEFEHDVYSKLAIVQIPLILAWGCTIHKSQGSTLDIVRINAGCGIFERGQLYVALSRVRTLEGLYLTDFHSSALKTDAVVTAFYKNFEE